MACSVSGTSDKATHPSHSWRHTRLKVRLNWGSMVQFNVCLSFCNSCLTKSFSFVLGPVWEVHFHPTNPDHLFTCSEDGSLLHWETSSQSDMPLFLQGNSNYSNWSSQQGDEKHIYQNVTLGQFYFMEKRCNVKAICAIIKTLGGVLLAIQPCLVSCDCQCNNQYTESAYMIQIAKS